MPLHRHQVQKTFHSDLPVDPLKDYLESIGRIPMLTAQEEIHLGHQVQESVRIRNTIPEAERTAGQRRTIKRGTKARDRMVSANLRLVVSCVKKRLMVRGNLDMLDLIQEGNLGLLRAVEKFDPTRGYKLSTYAYWWIRQGVGRAYAYQNRTIRLPGSALPAMAKAKDLAIEFQIKYGRMPTLLETAKHCGVTEESMMHYLSHYAHCASLDATYSSKSLNDHSPLKDTIADPKSLEENNFFDKEAETELISYLRSMPDEEYLIICHRHGLDGCQQLPLAELAKKLNRCGESIRRQERLIMNRMRFYLQQTMLDVDLTASFG